jgi:hypothetical protein
MIKHAPFFLGGIHEIPKIIELTGKLLKLQKQVSPR